MSELEKIKRYIEREKPGASVRYDMTFVECTTLQQQVCEGRISLLEVIELAFNYGRAKGSRAAKAEVRR